MTRLRRIVETRWLDAAIVAGMTVFIGILSGAQRWSGWTPPDSSFYLTLGLFGSDVTDRAIDDSYFWTRVGAIAPVRGLTEILGTWPGLVAFRLLLVALLVTASYVALRRFTGRVCASFLTMAWCLSTVVLSYLGNPYMTGAVLAGTTAVIAAALYTSLRASIVAGALLGWLATLHQPGFLLALTVWFVISVQRGFGWRRALSTFGAAAVVLVAFIGIGKLMFPGLNWLDTVVRSSRDMNYAGLADPTPLWLGDVSLVVPALATLACLVIWWTNRADAGAQAGLAMSVASVNFMLVFSPMMSGIPLEAPQYAAMLWPPTLLGLAIASTAVLPREAWSVAVLITAAVALAAVLVTGRIAPGLTPAAVVAIGVGLIVLLIAVLRWNVASTVTVVVAIGLVMACGQLVQNSREQRGFFYHLTPYVWAFQPNVLSERAHAAVNAEEWVLANTASTDRVTTWVQGDWFAGDRELYEVAAMQLWGPNRVAMTPRLTPEDVVQLGRDRPTVIAMYGSSMDGVLDFWSSIPGTNSPTPPQCYDFPWAHYPDSVNPVTEAHACLTRLHW